MSDNNGSNFNTSRGEKEPEQSFGSQMLTHIRVSIIATIVSLFDQGLRMCCANCRRPSAQSTRREGASRRIDPPHAANRIRVPGRLCRHLGVAAVQRLPCVDRLRRGELDLHFGEIEDRRDHRPGRGRPTTRPAAYPDCGPTECATSCSPARAWTPPPARCWTNTSPRITSAKSSTPPTPAALD